MVSDASLTCVNGPSHHRSSPESKSCAAATAFEFALHVNENGLRLATDEMMVSCRQRRSVRPAFPGYKNVARDVQSPGRGKPVMMDATKSEESAGTVPLRPERM